MGRGLHPRRRVDRLRRHVRPAVRRGPCAPGRVPALQLLRSHHRHGQRGQDRVRLRNEGHAPGRTDPDHAALRRRRLARPRPTGRTGRGGPAGQRCATDLGRGADLRLHRRLRGGRVEYRRLRANQACPGRAAHPAPEGSFRPGRHAPSRSGQVVPGRAPAAMGVGSVLAARRSSGLAGGRAHGGGHVRSRAGPCRRPGSDPAAGRPPRRRSRPHSAGARRSSALDQGGGGPACQCRSVGGGARRSYDARRPSQGDGGRAFKGGRLRPAGPARHRPVRRRPLAERGLELQA